MGKQKEDTVKGCHRSRILKGTSEHLAQAQRLTPGQCLQLPQTRHPAFCGAVAWLLGLGAPKVGTDDGVGKGASAVEVRQVWEAFLQVSV